MKRLAAALLVLVTLLGMSSATASAHTRRHVITHYTDARQSQSTINKCQLDLWWYHPLWLAGHNYCGYSWFAHLKRGEVVRVTHGKARGTYRVIGRELLYGHANAMPVVHADLVLQTCVGRNTSLTLLRRI